MQVVIDIPLKIYENALKGVFEIDTIRQAVITGTPLPKGHGRLIDANDIKTVYEKWREYFDKDVKKLLYDLIDKYVSTVVEADKESEEL